MRKKLLVVAIVMLVTLPSSARSRKYGNDSASVPISRLSVSQISQTPPGVTVKFEAIVVNRPSQKCIEVFTPDEFEKYEGDPKWAISSTLGFELGFFETLGRSRAIVTGKYVFVKDIHDGPCGIVTGNLFEISGIEFL